MAVDTDDLRFGAQDGLSRPALRLVERSLPSSNDNEAGAPGRATPKRATPPRRRGPLVTRWIGFAARRQRAQERTERLAREPAAERPRSQPVR